MTTKVPVPKGLLAGLVGVATVALLGVVFLLGRLSGPAAAQGAGATTPGPALAESAHGGSAHAAQALTPVSTPETPTTPTATLTGAPGMPPAAPPGPGLDRERLAVQAYFQAVARAQPPQAGDPETVARNLMAGFGRGDASGFETLVQQARTTREALAALQPPPPCADFHRESLAILDGNLELMQGLRAVLATTDPNPPSPDLTTRATALKARSEALQARERALRQRYNLEVLP